MADTKFISIITIGVLSVILFGSLIVLQIVPIVNPGKNTDSLHIAVIGIGGGRRNKINSTVVVAPELLVSAETTTTTTTPNEPQPYTRATAAPQPAANSNRAYSKYQIDGKGFKMKCNTGLLYTADNVICDCQCTTECLDNAILMYAIENNILVGLRASTYRPLTMEIEFLQDRMLKCEKRINIDRNATLPTYLSFGRFISISLSCIKRWSVPT